MRTVAPLFAVLALAAPLAAQQPAAPEKAAPMPQGWEVRLDRANASAADVKFTTMGKGLHATMGPAAILYKPAMTATGAYTVKATFTQSKAFQHPEAYGIFVGGKNLQDENQDYLYFIVRQDGKYMVKHRAGTEVHTLVPWTEHAAIAKLDEAGKATNTLALAASAEGIKLLVNGTEVNSVARVPYMNTDGIVGLRVNHHVDVHISDLTIEPAKK